MFEYLESEFRSTTSYLTETIVDKKVYNSSLPFNIMKLEKCLEVFNKSLIKHFEKKLVK